MFATHRATKFAATVVTASALGLSALVGAGTANALTSRTDANVLDAISAEGIAYDSAAIAVKNAQYVCSALDNGADPVDLGTEILDNTDLTTRQAAVFVVEAVGNYCPEFNNQLT